MSIEHDRIGTDIAETPETAEPLPRRGGTVVGSPSPAPVGVPHGRSFGLGAYALGLALMVATYVWGLAAAHSPGLRLVGSWLTRPTSDYVQWGLHAVFFLLPIVVMALAGWLIAGRGAHLYSGSCLGRPNSFGMAFGLGVFCGGVALIVLVFLTAMHYFGTTPGQVPAPTATADYPAWALGSVFQLLLLGILAFDGSLVTGRGVQLFLGSLVGRG